MEDRTRQEIDDYCEKVLNLHLSSRDDGKLMFEGVQIIKQLQEEFKTPAGIPDDVMAAIVRSSKSQEERRKKVKEWLELPIYE